MDQTHDYENECERYLLGQLSEQEQTQLEAQYFEDDALFERFLAVKDELVDAYARGQLSAEKRQRFEEHFLATEPRRRRAAEARQFISAVNALAEAPVKPSPGPAQVPAVSWWQSISERVGLPQLVFQGALGLLITASLIGGWMWFRNFQNRRAEDARARNEQQQLPPQSSETVSPTVEVVPKTGNDQTANVGGPEGNKTASPSPSIANRQPPPPAPAQIASLTLMPFAPRDGGASNTLQLKSDTRAVRLQLMFKGDDYRSYSVTLKTLEGQQVMQLRALKAVSTASGKSVTLNLDSAILTHQDYIVTLNGVSSAGQSEALAEYYFRVERQTSR